MRSISKFEKEVTQILDEKGLPHIVFNRKDNETNIPDIMFTKDDTITLNISPKATRGLKLTGSILTFEFSAEGKVFSVKIDSNKIKDVYGVYQTKIN